MFQQPFEQLLSEDVTTPTQRGVPGSRRDADGRERRKQVKMCTMSLVCKMKDGCLGHGEGSSALDAELLRRTASWGLFVVGKMIILGHKGFLIVPAPSNSLAHPV